VRANCRLSVPCQMCQTTLGRITELQSLERLTQAPNPVKMASIKHKLEQGFHGIFS